MRFNLYTLLFKYITGTIKQDDLFRLRNYVNLSDNEELSTYIQLLWNKYDPDKLPDKAFMLEIFKDIESRTKKKQLHLKIQKTTKYIAGIAAAFLILFFSITSLNLYQEKKQFIQAGEREMVVRSDKGQKVCITLPDSSIVHLNVASVLRYKLNYGDTIRKVNLKGEGFFEIKKDPAKPFIVQTKHLDIEVLGTSFNVYAYDEEQIVETTVVTGKVKVKTHTSPALVAYLKPDEKALYHPQTGDLKIAKTDKRMETAWLKGALVFRSVPLKEILYKLERKYGVTIHLDNKRIEEDVFTGSFDSEYISDIMKILQKHYQFKYKIEGDHVYITSSPQNK